MPDMESNASSPAIEPNPVIHPEQPTGHESIGITNVLAANVDDAPACPASSSTSYSRHPSLESFINYFRQIGPPEATPMPNGCPVSSSPTVPPPIGSPSRLPWLSILAVPPRQSSESETSNRAVFVPSTRTASMKPLSSVSESLRDRARPYALSTDTSADGAGSDGAADSTASPSGPKPGIASPLPDGSSFKGEDRTGAAAEHDELLTYPKLQMQESELTSERDMAAQTCLSTAHKRKVSERGTPDIELDRGLSRASAMGSKRMRKRDKVDGE
ncbi:hypothetical protein NA57DRAFT_70211 [Rhizodiscina lignyota]|uniref:Uncharacterized protein n=1 Tax=Rhizodiscina lignyota TaxID=1504668 RepID=A0A9P4IQN4_9PEZI|nr:hypothetical protein NA57DRAFT_70211 [Rhizodiscina lignyota]